MKDRVDVKLMRACAKYILGEAAGVKIKGGPESLGSLQEVLLASRELYHALQQERPLEEIRVFLEKKRAAAVRFRRTTGLTWRL